MRPIVSHTTAPAYKVCKFLNDIVLKLTDFKTKFFVKILVHKLRDFNESGLFNLNIL